VFFPFLHFFFAFDLTFFLFFRANESALLSDTDSLKKICPKDKSDEMIPIITVLPPHEAVDIYEKLYPLRGVNLEKNMFEQPVTPTQRGNLKVSRCQTPISLPLFPPLLLLFSNSFLHFLSGAVSPSERICCVTSHIQQVYFDRGESGDTSDTSDIGGAVGEGVQALSVRIRAAELA
jgi:hypothetical protein